MTEIKKQVEALLFSSGRSMRVADLALIMNLKEKEIRTALKELKEDYDKRDSSLMIMQEGDSWKLNIREQYVSLVTKIVADTELSKTVIETLGVIAWKAPALQSEIINIRSSQAYEHIKELVDLGFIRKEREGRSYLLRLTEKFFEYFDVPGEKGIKEALKEIKIPKKEDKKLGDLNIVPIAPSTSKNDLSSLEVAKTEMKKNFEVVDEPKQKVDIPPVDKEFLEKIDKSIDDISKVNDQLDDDELFKRKEPSEDGIFDDEESTNETKDDDSNQTSDDDSKETTNDNSDENLTESVEDSIKKVDEFESQNDDADETSGKSSDEDGNKENEDADEPTDELIDEDSNKENLEEPVENSDKEIEDLERDKNVSS